jgi:hypothetical protein
MKLKPHRVNKDNISTEQSKNKYRRIVCREMSVLPADVGRRVGELVGLLVGASVGAFVGAYVGAFVGM